MIEIIKSNPLLFICVVLVIVLLVLWFVIKTSKSKSKQKETVVKQDKSDKETKTSSDKKEQEPAKQQPEESSSEKQPKEKRVKKAKQTKSVEKVFKKEEVKSTDEPKTSETKSSISEDELLSKLEFVKDSKRVSKLTKLSDERLAELEEAARLAEASAAASEVVPEIIEEEPVKKTKYFSKEKRLSNFVEQDNFDEMFDSHISDKYLNVDVSRHLDVSEEVIQKLYTRASDTIAGSTARVLSTDDENYGIPSNRCGGVEAHVEKIRRETFANLIDSYNNNNEEISEDMKLGEISIDDHLKLDSKTLLVADALMKTKRNRKKH